MSNWIDYYKDESALVKKCLSTNGSKLPSPPGFTEKEYKLIREGKLKEGTKQVKTKQQIEEVKRLKRKKLWEAAIAPTKNIPMNAIMMYMTPNSIQVISIMMTTMLFFNSLKEIIGVNKKFENAELDSSWDLFVLKAIYVSCCSGNLLVGLWKLNAMGLIPNRSGDWISWEPRLFAAETAVI